VVFPEWNADVDGRHVCYDYGTLGVDLCVAVQFG
jgi:hypothetical protein